MKKKLNLILVSTFVLLISAFSFSACKPQPTTTPQDTAAHDKAGSIACVTDFFANTLNESDMVITVKSGDEVQVVENVLNSSSCYENKEGTKTTCFISADNYYYVIESADYRSYYTTDETKRGYDADAQSYYESSRFYFMSNVNLIELLSEDTGTFLCSSQIEEIDGEQVGTLNFGYTAQSGSLSITATATDGLVRSFSVVKNSLIAEESNTDITTTIVYGGASVSIPDTDAWDAEDEAEELRLKKIEDNENAIAARNEFLSSVTLADSVNVTAVNFLTYTTLLSETISGGIDYVNYGAYSTYTYQVQVSEEDFDVYYLYSGDEKTYSKSLEDFADNSFVWYSAFVSAKDDLVETADITCDVRNGVMTFNVKVDNSVIYSISATKNDGVISQISVGDGLTFIGLTITYDVEELELPNISEYKFAYRHDPRENASAMADIVEDATAIYGFRPSDSGSLSAYADEAWSDADAVEGWRRERITYHRSLESMYDVLDEMEEEGKSLEEIARTLSEMRNQIRLDAYKDDPEGLARLKARNLEKYGHEEGPLADELYEQYGSWEIVIAKAFSANSGMDACLGLYDDYYGFYVSVGQVE
jgi:hypothetical protein